MAVFFLLVLTEHIKISQRKNLKVDHLKVSIQKESEGERERENSRHSSQPQEVKRGFTSLRHNLCHSAQQMVTITPKCTNVTVT